MGHKLTFSIGKGSTSDSSNDSTRVSLAPIAAAAAASNTGLNKLSSRREYLQLLHAERARHDATADLPALLPPLRRLSPARPGARHKLSRENQRTKLADQVREPSSLAAGAIHMAPGSSEDGQRTRWK